MTRLASFIKKIVNETCLSTYGDLRLNCCLLLFQNFKYQQMFLDTIMLLDH